MYGADQLSDQISLTTASPLQRPGTSTVSQTTLPPVEVPVVSNLPPVEVPAVSSLPADLPATIPTPVNRNGVFSCSTSSSGITTNFVNPSYPGYDSNTGLCKFYLILNSGVCQVRVDFVDTQLLSPVRGECSQQSLQVTGTIFPLGVNNFCGVNTDQHFYIETVSRGEASYVEFSVDTRVAANYKWGLWITQISCDGTRTIQAISLSISLNHSLDNQCLGSNRMFPVLLRPRVRHSVLQLQRRGRAVLHQPALQDLHTDSLPGLPDQVHHGRSLHAGGWSPNCVTC